MNTTLPDPLSVRLCPGFFCFCSHKFSLQPSFFCQDFQENNKIKMDEDEVRPSRQRRRPNEGSPWDSSRDLQESGKDVRNSRKEKEREHVRDSSISSREIRGGRDRKDSRESRDSKSEIRESRDGRVSKKDSQNDSRIELRESKDKKISKPKLLNLRAKVRATSPSASPRIPDHQPRDRPAAESDPEGEAILAKYLGAALTVTQPLTVRGGVPSPLTEVGGRGGNDQQVAAPGIVNASKPAAATQTLPHSAAISSGERVTFNLYFNY